MNTPPGEETIFAEALGLPVEERASFLARSTEGNPELRQRLEALLTNYGAAHFLEQAAASELRKTLITELTEKAGDTIGRYKLLQQIGEGGCGVVYMAEQTEPVRRRVAIKIIKLGMDTKSVIARFEAERQALAMMDHPNIAKVLDAGATETGRPYFAMELVRGMRITEYCDEKKLPTRARLDLFMQVCQAIQHARQKGIIHRDIKPSNILVSVNDGVAVPKVIDFGIAKATTGQQLTNKTLFTAFEQFVGTPAYMSPEQALVTSLDIDTRSDIYALGVLLYELLTGKTPFDANELLAIGLDEMRRAIREQEPAKPSARLSTLSGKELSTAAQRRGLDSPKLVSELRGDLDWIVMKALEKDRARRYETANGLSSDILRHLRNEPVVACPPSTLYRLRKAFQRNRLVFGAGSAVAASLVIGLSLSTVSFLRERIARARADEQAAIAQSVSDFLLEDLLHQVDSRFQAEAQFTPDPNLTVREALDRAAERIDRFRNQPLQEAAVRLAIGKALIGLGEAERAVSHLERALELRRAKLVSDDPDTLSAMFSLAYAYELTGGLKEALPLIQETLDLRKARLGADHSDTLRSMNLLANVYQELGRLDQTLPLREAMLKLAKARLVPDDPLTLIAMANLGMSYENAGQPAKALPLSEEVMNLARAKLRAGHPFIAQAMADMANRYAGAGRFDQALPLCEEALKLDQSSRGPNHPQTLHTMCVLGSIYVGAGKFDQALPLVDRAFKEMQTRMANHPETLTGMHLLADAYYRAGKFNDAVPFMEQVVRLQTAKLGADNSKTWEAKWNLALLYLRTNKPEQAVTIREEMFKIAVAKYGPEHWNTVSPMGDLGIAWRAAGRFDKSLPLLEKTVKLHQEKVGPDDPKTLRWISDLGRTYWMAGKLDQALVVFQDALLRSQKTFGLDNPSTLMVLNKLGWVHIEVNGTRVCSFSKRN